MEQEISEHNIRISLEDEQQCGERTFSHPAFIKKDVPKNINSYQFDFQEVRIFLKTDLLYIGNHVLGKKWYVQCIKMFKEL